MAWWAEAYFMCSSIVGLNLVVDLCHMSTPLPYTHTHTYSHLSCHSLLYSIYWNRNVLTLVGCIADILTGCNKNWSRVVRDKADVRCFTLLPVIATSWQREVGKHCRSECALTEKTRQLWFATWPFGLHFLWPMSHQQAGHDERCKPCPRHKGKN